MHDYNDAGFKGAKEAVDKFISETPDAHFVPLSDHAGTMVFIK